MQPSFAIQRISPFCGGLTTFSTFSAEIVEQLQQGRPALAGVAIAMHLGGSLLFTLAGLALASSLRGN